MLFMLLFGALFGSSSFVFAQQNLFNSPSGDITPQNEFFYQHQLNFYEVGSVHSKQHFVYGLGHGLDVGFNVLDVPASHLSTWKEQNRPLWALTAQKRWDLTESVFFNVGAQWGARFFPHSHRERSTGFTYGLVGWAWGEHSRLVAGVYHTLNQEFLKGPDRQGVLLGYEIFVNKRWGLMGDYISGKTESSVAVIGAIYNLSNNWQLCAGALIPNTRVHSGAGLVLELNAFTFDFFH